MLRFTCLSLVWLAATSGSMVLAQQGGQGGENGAKVVEAARPEHSKKKVDARLAKIEAALNQPVKLELIDTPLNDVMQFLSDLTKTPIRIDGRSLEDYGISTDEPITLSAADISLAEGLDIVLRPIDLTWTVDRGAIVVTTPEGLDGMRTTETYDVSRLLGDAAGEGVVVYEGGSSSGELDDLIDLIVSSVDEYNWEEMGGIGVINGCTLRGGRLLIVTHHYQTHRKLKAFLNKLDSELPAAKPAVAAAGSQIRVYPLVENENTDAGEIAILVKKAIAKESWENDGAIDAVAGSLVVKNNPVVQAQVKKLLISLQVLAYNPAGMFGGGGFSSSVPVVGSQKSNTPQMRQGGFFNKPSIIATPAQP